MSKPPPRGLKLLPLIALIYCLSASGPFGIEELIPASGPGLSILLILALPIFYGLPLGLAAGEMSSRFPVEGGYYRWIRVTFGDFWGAVAGCWAWIGGIFDGALYAALLAEYVLPFVEPLLPGRWHGAARLAIALAALALCLWANLRGIAIVGWSSFVFTLFILSPFVAMCGLGLLHWERNPLLPFRPPGTTLFQAFGVGALVGMWSYSGYESLSTAAEEIEDPRRNYLRAVLIAILLGIPSYLFPVLIGLATTPDWAGVSAGWFSDLGRRFGGMPLQAWISAAGVISMVALLNSYTLAYSRIPFTMAQDGFLPRGLARTHRTRGTPWAALLLTAIIEVVLLAVFDIQTLVVLEMWCFCALYILIYLAILRLRWRPDLDRQRGDAGYRFVIPAGRWGIWVVIGPPILLAVGAMLWSGEEYVRGGGVVLLIGAVISAFAVRLRRGRPSASPGSGGGVAG